MIKLSLRVRYKEGLCTKFYYKSSALVLREDTMRREETTRVERGTNELLAIENYPPVQRRSLHPLEHGREVVKILDGEGRVNLSGGGDLESSGRREEKEGGVREEGRVGREDGKIDEERGGSRNSLDSILTVPNVGSNDSVRLDDGPEDAGFDVAVGRLVRRERDEDDQFSKESGKVGRDREVSSPFRRQ